MAALSVFLWVTICQVYLLTQLLRFSHSADMLHVKKVLAQTFLFMSQFEMYRLVRQAQL